jgi:hypothetical protein
VPGLIIGPHKYLIGVNPPMRCCGEEKKVFEAFSSEYGVKAFTEKVIEQLNRDGTTKNLKLYEAYPAVSARMH